MAKNKKKSKIKRKTKIENTNTEVEEKVNTNNTIIEDEKRAITTKMYKGYQTVVPSQIRKKLNVSANDILEWTTTEDGGAKVMFRTKKSLNDIIGKAHSEKETNAVELKKLAQKGDDKL